MLSYLWFSKDFMMQTNPASLEIASNGLKRFETIYKQWFIYSIKRFEAV